MFLTPWALTKRADYQKRMEQREDVSRVSPGAFKESAKGDRVFFVESVADAGEKGERVGSVFINSVQHGRMGVIAAERGHTEVTSNGDKFMVLTNGRRYEATAGSTEYRVMEFKRYSIRSETAENLGVEKTARHLPIWELLNDRTRPNLGELLWRIGVPLSALTLALLAIPLSFVNPRAGRTNNLLFALLTFMIYSNFLSVSQAWVAQGRLPFAIGVWAVHVLMFVVLVFLFWKRLAVFSIWRRKN